MAFKSIKQNLKEVINLLKAYADSTLDYYKLKVIKRIAKASGKLFRIFILLLFIPLVLFFFSIAGAICIGNYLGNYALGFVIIGAFYFVLLFIVLLLGRVIVQRPIIRRLAKKMFKEKK